MRPEDEAQVSPWIRQMLQRVEAVMRENGVEEPKVEAVIEQLIYGQVGGRPEAPAARLIALVPPGCTEPVVVPDPAHPAEEGEE